MATALPTPVCDTSCPAKDEKEYDRIVLEPSPDMEKELDDAKEFLDYVLCRVPDQTEEKYEEIDYDEDLGRLQRKTDEIKPDKFPYSFILMDEKSFDKPVFRYKLFPFRSPHLPPMRTKGTATTPRMLQIQ